MSHETDLKFEGKHGTIVFHRWEPDGRAEHAIVIVHGYGEHGGRYDHVARALASSVNAVVYAPDLMGHGRSDGERAFVTDFDDYVADVRALVKVARADHPDAALAMIGHSMGGIIATLYAYEHGHELDAVVLSAPLIGGNPGFQQLLEADPMPEVPIDPSLLSRDAAVGEAYAADELVYHGPFKRELLKAAFDAIDRIAGEPPLATMPILWIHGEDDQLAPIDLARAAVTNVGGEELEHETYAGARHELFNETNKDEVIAEVARFLQGALAGLSDRPDTDSPQDHLAHGKTPDLGSSAYSGR